MKSLNKTPASHQRPGARTRRVNFMPTKTLAERFWEKVDRRGPDECWPWTGARAGGRYGHLMGSDGETVRAHRVAYEMRYGKIPAGDGFHGTCVCHTCDNPSCVNPAHLFLGTHADNMADRDRKGRLPDRTGSANPRSELSEGDVDNIRANAMNLTRQETADLFGVSKSLIEKILSRKVWAHV